MSLHEELNNAEELMSSADQDLRRAEERFTAGLITINELIDYELLYSAAQKRVSAITCEIMTS